MERKTCQQRVYGGGRSFGGSSCSNRATVTEKGKHLCSIHNQAACDRRDQKREDRRTQECKDKKKLLDCADVLIGELKRLTGAQLKSARIATSRGELTTAISLSFEDVKELSRTLSICEK